MKASPDFNDGPPPMNNLATYFGDLKFDSPPFLDDKKTNDLIKVRFLITDTTKRIDERNERTEESGTSSPDSEDKKTTVDVASQIFDNIIRILDICRWHQVDVDILRDLEKRPNAVREKLSTKSTPNVCYKHLALMLNALNKEITSELEKCIKKLQSNLWKCFDILLENLELQGLKTERKILGDKSKPEQINPFFEENKDVFNIFLFGRYSHFSRDSLSLLFQVANLLKCEPQNIDEFITFRNVYARCRQLREFLCSSPNNWKGTRKTILKRYSLSFKTLKKMGITGIKSKNLLINTPREPFLAMSTHPTRTI